MHDGNLGPTFYARVSVRRLMRCFATTAQLSVVKEPREAYLLQVHEIYSTVSYGILTFHVYFATRSRHNYAVMYSTQ